MEKEEVLFKCGICMKEFKKEKNYQAHVRRHVVPKAYPCEICGDVYMDLIDLQHHKVSHNGKTTHECGICHKLFSRKSTLRIHMRLHSSDKKYECSYCGKTSGTKYDLSCHMRTHTGERPYQCDNCTPPSTFSTRSSLMRHKRKHSGYQPYECKNCNKTFSRKDQYARHINMHLEYNCEICGQYFDSYIKFVSHKPLCDNTITVSGTGTLKPYDDTGQNPNPPILIPLLDIDPDEHGELSPSDEQLPQGPILEIIFKKVDEKDDPTILKSD